MPLIGIIQLGDRVIITKIIKKEKVMEIKRLSKDMKTVTIVKLRQLRDYPGNEPHVDNEEKWRLKCLKIPI